MKEEKPSFTDGETRIPWESRKKMIEGGFDGANIKRQMRREAAFLEKLGGSEIDDAVILDVIGSVNLSDAVLGRLIEVVNSRELLELIKKKHRVSSDLAKKLDERISKL